MLSRFAALLTGSKRDTEKEERNRVQVAACVVMVEAAHADQEFTHEERAHIVDAMQKRFSLTAEEAHELLEEAEAIHSESHSLFGFTRAINENFSVAEKIETMEEVWRLMYSDGVLNAHEDHLVHKLQHLLNLNHQQLIEAKMRVLAERRG